VIVTIVHAALPAADAHLAADLALQRARRDRKVLPLATRTLRGTSLTEQLERILARHDDVVVATQRRRSSMPQRADRRPGRARPAGAGTGRRRSPL
jgi:hypothetical protein